MRQLLLFLATLIFSYQAHAQQYTLSSKLVESFMDDPEKAENVTISTSVSEQGIYEFKLTMLNKPESFTIKPLTYPNFEAKLKTTLKKLIVNVPDPTGDGSLMLKVKESRDIEYENEIALLFTQIVTFLNSENDRPQVATIYLKEVIYAYHPKKKLQEGDKSKTADNTKNDVLKLENVSVEISFYGGFIEKMQVNATVNNIAISFSNKYSMGISSTNNLKNLKNNRLYSIEAFEPGYFNDDKKGNNDPPQYSERKYTESLFLHVDDVIRYVKKVDVNANDISPVPQLVILDKDTPESKLHREESAKLFEAVVYSDLLGIFDEENPNGIIQTEIRKRFNINTSRGDFPFLFEGGGWLQYFDAKFRFSKIETKNKFLTTDLFEGVAEDGSALITKYFKPISLYQHRIFAVGGVFNIFFLENQNAKMNIMTNAGFLFGRTGIKESEADEIGKFTNNIEIPIEATLHLLPEKRFSFALTSRFSWFETLDSEIYQRSILDRQLSNKHRWLHTFVIDVNLDISSNGRMFFRYNLIHDLDEIDTNFSQLQLGYSFFILQNNGARKNNVRFD